MTIILHTEGRTLIWIALCPDTNEPMGSVSLTIEDISVKLNSALVKEEYRGKGVYRQLFNCRQEYINTNFKGYLAYGWFKDNTIKNAVHNGFEVGENCTYASKTIY